MSREGIRPPRKARRLGTVWHTQARRLAPGVVELLLRHATVLSEGSVREGCGARPAWFGSTMLTIDLRAVADELRAPVDEALAAELAPLLTRSAHLKITALRLARHEAEARIPDWEPGRLTAQTRVHAAGTTIHVDVDVEIALGAAGRRRRTAAGAPG